VALQEIRALQETLVIQAIQVQPEILALLETLVLLAIQAQQDN
jgi:hypothetical protein